MCYLPTFWTGRLNGQFNQSCHITRTTTPQVVEWTGCAFEFQYWPPLLLEAAAAAGWTKPPKMRRWVPRPALTP